MLCFGEKRHRIGNTEGYVYIWNYSLNVQKAYSSSTQLTRLKIQINTQITQTLTQKSFTSQKKSSKIIRYHSSINSPIYPTSRPTKIIPTQNQKSTSIPLLSDKLQYTLYSLSYSKHKSTLSTQTPLKSNHKA